MIYLDDRLPSHPKILKAGSRIGGKNGAALALAMYVTGLSYAREHETDGFIPDAFLGSCAAFSSPGDIARALADRYVKLWERVRGGYRIHDYHDWNRKSSEIKAQREKWREKKRAQRRGGNGRWSPDMSPGDKNHVSEMSHRDSRARTRSHVPRTTGQATVDTYGITSTAGCTTARSARGNQKPVEKKQPTHRILCAMLRAEWCVDGSLADALEGVKVRCARQGFAYPEGDRLDAAVQAVERVIRKAS